jgi:catechol-2,3-dioxygenase
MPPVLERIDHIHVFVADREAAESWYREVLGLRRVPELAFWATDGGPLTLADAGGAIHLALFEKPARPCRSTIALAVNAEGFMAWLKHLSGTFGQALQAVDHQVAWSMYFADPDGNPYEITCYEHEAVAARLHEQRS